MAEKNFKVRKGLNVGESIGINTDSASVSLDVRANDAIRIPIGNTGQRPSSANGLFRYNSETNTFEGHTNGLWGPIGGSGGYYKGSNGTIGNANNAQNIFRINSANLTQNVTISSGENALAAGPISLANGVVLTISTGGRVAIV